MLIGAGVPILKEEFGVLTSGLLKTLGTLIGGTAVEGGISVTIDGFFLGAIGNFAAGIGLNFPLKSLWAKPFNVKPIIQIKNRICFISYIE
jgi:hypothetical protein